jgi:hypothetical protein
MAQAILLNLSSDNRQSGQSTDDYIIQFNSPINLGDNVWEMSVVSANLWNANPNISGPLYNNNYFSYFNGAINQVITIPEGIYNTAQLNAEIQRQITANGDTALNVVFTANPSTLRIELTTLGGYTVDLGTGSLLYELLGFSPAQIAAPLSGFVVADFRANLNRGINNIYLRCDLVDPSGSYDSKVGSDILTDLAFQGRPPGSSVYIEKKYQMWIPVKRQQFLPSVRVRITDQLGRRYSIRDEPLNVQLYMRPSKQERNRKLFENFAVGVKGQIQRLQ